VVAGWVPAAAAPGSGGPVDGVDDGDPPGHARPGGCRSRPRRPPLRRNI